MVHCSPPPIIKADFVKVGDALGAEMSGRALAEAQLIAQTPQTEALLSGALLPGSETPADWLAALCRDNGLLAVRILPVSSMTPHRQLRPDAGHHDRYGDGKSAA